MLSRVAEIIFWMSRYLERAENIARFVGVNVHLMLDIPGDEDQQWMPLVRVTGDTEWFEKHYGEATRDNVIQFLTFDENYPHSIRSCLRQARENARSVREAIPTDLWEQINRFYLMTTHSSSEIQAHYNPHDFFSRIRLEANLCYGLCETSLTHNEAWYFWRLGQFLERADKTSRILDVKYFLLLPSPDYVGMPIDNIQWAAVLKSASALTMYRRKHHRITPTDVADFLLFDRDFPRSILYCLSHAIDALHAITLSPVGTYGNSAEHQLGRLASDLNYTTIDEVIQQGLHEFVDRLQLRINRANNAVYETFFATQSPPTQQLPTQAPPAQTNPTATLQRGSAAT